VELTFRVEYDCVHCVAGHREQHDQSYRVSRITFQLGRYSKTLYIR